MKTSHKEPASVPVFASVISPTYRWSEYETKMTGGLTKLPKRGASQEASIEVPSLEGGTPDARAVRKHEMLHVAFTPDITPVAERLAKEGLKSGAVLQLAEDLRLALIAYHKGLQREDDYYSQETVLGLVNQLMDSAQGAETVEGGSKQLNVAIATTLISMCGQPFWPLRDEDDERLISWSLGDNITRLSATAEAAYGSLGREAMERILYADDGKAYRAATDIYDLYNKTRGNPVPAGKERAPWARETFEVLYRNVHTALEALMYDDPPKKEPPPFSTPSPFGEDSGVDGGKKEDGAGGGDDEPKPEVTKPDESKKPDEPKADAKGKPGAEERPKPSSQEVTDNKIASESIDQIERMMGKSLMTAAAEHVRHVLKSAQEASLSAPESIEGLSGPEMAPCDTPESNQLVEVERLNLSMDLSGEVRWAPMDIFTAPLERSFKVRVPRRGRPSLDGEIPRHWSRWFADRAILDNRGRRPGGTLLVDVSESMRWSREQTLALINETPAMTIALYSSGDEISEETGKSYTGRGFRGRLTIIARQGRAIAESYDWRWRHGSANACDGPALAWLARQPGPRVWFSDGEITTLNHNSRAESIASDEAVEEATRIIKLGNIVRTTEVGDVTRIFSGLAPESERTSRDCGPRLSLKAARSVFTRIAAAHWKGLVE